MPRPMGNGPGWGGPAKGEGNRDGVIPGGRPIGAATGSGKQSVASLMAEAGAREIAAARWLAILNDPNHPHHAAMIAKAADRMDGAPVAKMEHSIRDVPADQLTDDELAAIAIRGRRPAEGAETDPD